ncbi:MAG: carboxypeptidase regulatory-like domain-containing protein, partial [Myxococcaceae bacterium]|nr:carboxypeptidase regulatory-like domain-containing protein [Myxococcaceae bacterium]
MRRSLAVAFTLVGVLAGAGCRDLVIPPEPGAPKPGSIQGKVVGSEPGRPGTKPLAGVQVEVLGLGLTTVTDSDGYFRIDGVTTDAGQILFRFDSDHDGKPDRQKLLSLKALKAGPDKNVALGDVLLSENATIRGKVLLDEVATASGHAGTLIFVPVGPYKTTTGDDGSFVLTDLPEGSVSIAFFAQGHAPDGFDNLTLSGGQELTLRTVRLKVATMASPPATVKGRVLVSDGSAAAGASVALQGTGPALNATAGSDGAFTFMDVQTGLYTVTASRTGAASARFVNLLVSGVDVTLPDLVLGTGSGGGAGGGGGGEGGGAGGGAGGSAGGGAGGGSGGGAAGG